MFHAYVTHSQAKAYLQQLITSGLVEHDPLEKTFNTTAKGMEYLRVIEKMTELFPVAKRNSSKAELFAF